MSPDSSSVPWLSSVDASLLTDRTVSNYLNSYDDKLWPQVLRLTLLYGIVGLQQQYPEQHLSVLQLKQIVQAAATTLVVQRNVPRLQRQILGMQSDLDKVFDNLTVELPRPEAHPTVPAQQATLSHEPGNQEQMTDTEPMHQQQHRDQQRRHKRAVHFAEPAGKIASGDQRRLADPPRRHQVHVAVVAPKPSGAWRAGEASGFLSPPRAGAALSRALDNQGATTPIYPDWWLTTPADPKPAAALVPPQQPVPQQPCLASCAQPLLQQKWRKPDGRVASEYLPVSSSSAGQQPEILVAANARREPLIKAARITPDDSTAAQQQPQQLCHKPQNQGPVHSFGRQRQHAAGQHRPARKPVESKIKELITANRQRAAQSAKQRQEVLAATVAAGCVGGQLSQQAAAADAEASCAPASAAEQFISNRWTSWFISDAAEQHAPWTVQAAAAVSGATERLLEVHQSIDNGGLMTRSSSSSSSSSIMSAAYAQEVTMPEDLSAKPGSPVNLQSHLIVGDSHKCSAWDQNIQSNPQQSAASCQDLTVKDKTHQHAWAFDFGHLDVPELDQAVARSVTGPTTQAAGGRPRQKWSEKWVGNFGHLEGPRFSSQTAFSHHQSPQQQQHNSRTIAVDADDLDPDTHQVRCSRLFMSPQEMQQLVTASKQFSEAPYTLESLERSKPCTWSAEQQEQEEEASVQSCVSVVAVDEVHKVQEAVQPGGSVCNVADIQGQPGPTLLQRPPLPAVAPNKDAAHQPEAEPE